MKLITTAKTGSSEGRWVPRPTPWSPLVTSSSRFSTEEIVESWTLLMGTSITPGPYYERYVRDVGGKVLPKALPTDLFGYHDRGWN